MKGITIKSTIGVGDALQFSSLPENYFRATGQKLYDVSRPWFFDHNPFVERNPNITPSSVMELWNFGTRQYQWPKLREQGVYLSNAEIHASVLGVPVSLNRPRLYRFEDFPYEKRETIVLHTDGLSNGRMPDHVIVHILNKYGKTNRLIQVGLAPAPLGIPYVETKTLWELAEVISSAKLFIGQDSGPGWVANCFPDVVVKKLRTKPEVDRFKEWVPLSVDNVHSHWDDRCHQVFNPSEQDVGFTSTYRKL